MTHGSVCLRNAGFAGRKERLKGQVQSKKTLVYCVVILVCSPADWVGGGRVHCILLCSSSKIQSEAL